MFLSLISILTKQQRLIRVILHQRAKSDEMSSLMLSSALKEMLPEFSFSSSESVIQIKNRKVKGKKFFTGLIRV